MAGPPSRPKLARAARTCSPSSTRPMRASPSSVVSRRTRMFSNGSRSQMGSSRPAASQKRDSRCEGSSAISCSQSARHVRLVGPAPVGGVELGPGHRLARGGADQPDPLLHPAIVEHAGRRRQQDGGALRAGVDGEPGLAVGAGLPCADIEGGIGGQRHQPVAAANLHEIGGGSGAGMLVERLPSDDR